MSKFKLTGSASKAAVQKATAKGGGYKRFKISGDKARLLLIGPVEEGEAVFGTNIIHQHFNGGSFVCKAASPEAFEKKDRLKEIGWKLKNKYDPKDGKAHSNKKIKDFWKDFMPKTIRTINVLDLDNVDAGVQQYDAPTKVMEVIFDEIEENDSDLTTICDLNEGRQLLIKKSGTGLMTKYVAKFSTKTADLNLSAEEEDELVKQVKPLSKAQEPYDEAAYEKVVDYLTARAEKMGIDLSDLEAEEDEELEDEDDADDSDDEFDDDAEEEIVDADEDDEELEDDEEIDDDEEEEPVKAPAKKKVATKRK